MVFFVSNFLATDCACVCGVLCLASFILLVKHCVGFFPMILVIHLYVLVVFHRFSFQLSFSRFCGSVCLLHLKAQLTTF